MRAKLLFPAAAAAAGLLLALIVIEVGLRLAGISYPRTWAQDPIRGRVLIANQERWYGDEGGAFLRINSAGFRDDEWTVDKPAKTLRIAVLGDSFVEAEQVAKEERFTEIVEQQLTASGMFGDRAVEVMNFGVAGYGTAEELLTFRHVARKYSPDIVLLAFFGGNDLINNLRALEQKNKPYFVLRNGALELDDSFRQSTEFSWPPAKRAAFWAIDRSSLLQVALRARERWSQPPQARTRAEIAAAGGYERLGISRMIYAPPVQKEWRDAWDVTDALLLQFGTEVKATGARFMVVTLTTALQVHPSAKERARLLERLRLPDLFYLENRIRALGESHGFEVLNLGPALQRYAESRNVYLHGFSNTTPGTGHWNELGHKLAGEQIAGWLQERLRRDPAERATN